MVPSMMASHPGPEAAKQPHTITLPAPRLTVGMLVLRQRQKSVLLDVLGSFMTSWMSRHALLE